MKSAPTLTLQQLLLQAKEEERQRTPAATAAVAAIECACLYAALYRYGFTLNQIHFRAVGEAGSEHIVLRLRAQNKRVTLGVCPRGDAEVFSNELRRLLAIYVDSGSGIPRRTYRASIAYKDLLDRLLDMGFVINRRVA